MDDVVYEIDCKKITKGAENIDIGANPSAEEEQEALDETTEQVIDVVDAFRLNHMQGAFGTKKDFQGQLKGMCKSPALCARDLTGNGSQSLLSRIPQESRREDEGERCG